MSETTVKIPKHLKTLDESLKTLSEKASFEQAQIVVNNVISLLGIDQSGSWKPFNDSQGKIRSNAGWFMVAEGFSDKRAAYKIADNNSQNIDLKCFWMKKLNKSVISWLVALTPNFEDEPFYGNLNVGIDFVIPEEANRVLVVLSKNYVIRTVELQDDLSITQQDIFNAWLTDFDYLKKAQVHETLWNSFDLEPVNKSFYKGISAFFVELKQFLSEDAKIFDDKHAAYFTNRLIGRIVFCWFLNKKGIINPEVKYFDVGELTASEYYHLRLETLFFKVLNTPIEERDESDNDPQKKMFPELAERNIFNMDVDFKTPFLNGGLFEVKDNDKFEDLDLAFPNDYFDRLFQFLRHYNFTTDESTATFQQVAIDPEMLGRIFENLLAEQVEETGEQARKAKGAFYTPREIVDYMCRESLREYLKSKIPEDEQRDQRIGLLLDVKPHEFRDQQRNYRSDLKPYKYDILKALDELKVIDPACGSGAFPMGMLHLLLDIYDRLDATFDPYKKKIEVIKNNLYGVDIEPMAVEICRLRAWLSIIVDEESDSKKIEPLPNLDFKFICANSLIPLIKENGEELFDTINQDELVEIRDKYFNARTLKSKNNLKSKFEKKIDYRGSGNMYSSDREKQLRTYHPFNAENISQFFDTEFMFGIKDGFDIVVGNPPYIDSEQMVKTQKDMREFYSKCYLTTKGNWDLYIPFFEFGTNLLSKGGVLSFITPNKWLSIKYGATLRSYFRNRISQFTDCDKINVFDAGNNPIITFVKSSALDLNSDSFNNDYTLEGKKNVKRKLLDKNNWGILLSKQIVLINKVLTSNDSMKRVIKSENPFSVSEAYELKPLLKELQNNNNKNYFKFCNTGTISSFKPLWGERDTKYLKEVYIKPIIDKDEFKKMFPRRFSQVNKQKIIIKGIRHFDSFLDQDGSFIAGKSTLIVGAKDEKIDLKGILGILNSTFIKWWIVQSYKVLGIDGGINFTTSMIEELPFKYNSKILKQIANKVDVILNKKTLDAKLMSQLDELVFDLYELTSKEREVMLGKENV